MKIAVCVKRVPDTEARIRVSTDGRSIDPSGVKYVVNPYDEFAVEAALRQREAAGEGHVTVLTVGGPESGETLRAVLAMGADDAILLRSEGHPEGLAVARAIAAELEDGGFDLVLLGLKAIDDDLQAVGAMVGELLRLPTVTAVSDFRREGDRLVAEREIEGGVEVVDVNLPCVLTITKGAFEPRYASLKGIMAAKKKPLQEREAKTGERGVAVEALEPPAERQAGRIVGEGPDAVPELLRILREEAKVL